MTFTRKTKLLIQEIKKKTDKRQENSEEIGENREKHNSEKPIRIKISQFSSETTREFDFSQLLKSPYNKSEGLFSSSLDP